MIEKTKGSAGEKRKGGKKCSSFGSDEGGRKREKKR